MQNGDTPWVDGALLDITERHDREAFADAGPRSGQSSCAGPQHLPGQYEPRNFARPRTLIPGLSLELAPDGELPSGPRKQLEIVHQSASQPAAHLLNDTSSTIRWKAARWELELERILLHKLIEQLVRAPIQAEPKHLVLRSRLA